MDNRNYRNQLIKIAKECRNEHGIVDSFDPDCKICQDITVTFFKKTDNANIASYGFIPKKFGIPDLTHYAAVAGVNTEDGPRWFLVDLTYSQFFTEDYVLDSGTIYQPPGCYMKTKEQKAFANQLRYYGFIDFTKENVQLYLDGFIDAYDKIEKLDRTQIYQNLENSLKNSPVQYTVNNNRSYFKNEEAEQITLEEAIQRKQLSMQSDCRSYIDQLTEKNSMITSTTK